MHKLDSCFDTVLPCERHRKMDTQKPRKHTVGQQQSVCTKCIILFTRELQAVIMQAIIMAYNS